MEEAKLKDALMKKALGYDTEEVSEEFTVDEEGNEHLNKKKVSKKHYSPDVSALKILIDRFYPNSSIDISKMSDEELLAEREKILKFLKEEIKNEY